MPRTILGARIRERRRGKGITQAELARRLGISPSYLNLIEHNKRGIAGALLRKTADALELELEDLDGAAERHLLATLDEIAHATELVALGVEGDRAGELIGRFPGWARAVASMARSEQEASNVARALSDRLTHDPFLSETVHGMLTHISAIRSAAEILTDHDDIETHHRDRFTQMIHQESRVLSDIGESLATYFDRADEAERKLTPLDEVEALFETYNNHFPQLEAAASALHVELRAPGAGSRAKMSQSLAENRLGGDINSFIDAQSATHTSLARKRASAALTQYAAGAILTPMTEFAPRAADLQYDVEGLAETFGIGVETVCHRLSALPVEDGVPQFGYFRVNAAGTIVERRTLPGLSAPRYASACPLWVLYRAQQSPESVIRQRALFPSGARFVFLARARNAGPTGFGKPRHYLTDMLTLTERDAALTIYAPDGSVPVEPVGHACRSCPRRDCTHRVDDPLAS